MRALVTGAGGFIRGVLVEELTARGHGVRGLFLPAEDAGKAAALGVEIVAAKKGCARFSWWPRLRP